MRPCGVGRERGEGWGPHGPPVIQHARNGHGMHVRARVHWSAHCPHAVRVRVARPLIACLYSSSISLSSNISLTLPAASFYSNAIRSAVCCRCMCPSIPRPRAVICRAASVAASPRSVHRLPTSRRKARPKIRAHCVLWCSCTLVTTSPLWTVTVTGSRLREDGGGHDVDCAACDASMQRRSVQPRGSRRHALQH